MTIRQEILNCVESIPDEELAVLRPLLHMLAYERLIIETDLTDEEKEIIRQGRVEYEANPESFVRLEDVL